MPFVSVVVPTHNRPALLRRTLASVFGQQAIDFEVIVVDDGSSEDIRSVAAAYERAVVRRIETRRGVSAARNVGIAAARGEWVAFCDDDDVWAPDKLASQLAAAQEIGAGWVYSGDVNVDDSLRVLSGAWPPSPDEVLSDVRRWNPLSSGSSNVMVRADLLRETGGFDTDLKRTEDWDLWLRLVALGRPAWVCRPLVAYRFHSRNVVGDLASLVDEPRRLAAKYNIPVDLAAMHRRAAWTALRAGSRRDALTHYGYAIAEGDLTSIGRAAIACVHPGVGTNALFRLLPQDRAWIAEAQHWLSTFAEEMSPPTVALRPAHRWFP